MTKALRKRRTVVVLKLGAIEKSTMIIGSEIVVYFPQIALENRKLFNFFKDP
jgi:hypothetical protein